MRIVKFLESQYNPTGEGQTIRVGTLEYYRSLPEEEGIGDFLEGLAGFTTSETTTLTPETAKHFMPGLKKGVMSVSGGGGLFKGVHNCYVFCATRFEEWDVDESIFPQYDSYYTIRDVPAFARFLGMLLQRSFSLEDVQDYSLHRLNRVPASEIRIGLKVDWGQVEYGQEKLLEISNANVSRLANFSPSEFIQTFCKPEKYANQREFRILLRPFCPSVGFIAVKPSPKNLDLSLKSEVQALISR